MAMPGGVFEDLGAIWLLSAIVTCLVLFALLILRIAAFLAATASRLLGRGERDGLVDVGIVFVSLITALALVSSVADLVQPWVHR